MFLPARSARPDVPLVSLFIVENISMLHAMASSAAHHLKAERAPGGDSHHAGALHSCHASDGHGLLVMWWLDMTWWKMEKLRKLRRWRFGYRKKRTKRTFGKMGKVCRRLIKLPKQLAFEWWLRGKRWLKVGGLKNEETEGGLSRKNWDLPPSCCHFALPHAHKNVG